jgi:DNA-binding transcriptional regulator YdaS (Cro superfamily)
MPNIPAMSNIHVFRSACDAAGGKGRLAAALGVTPPSVHQWYDGTRPLPADRVLAVSRATSWQVTPHALRPDIYPNPTDGLPPEVARKPPAAKPVPVPTTPLAPTLGEPRLGSDRRDDERRKPDPRADQRRVDERRQEGS